MNTDNNPLPATTVLRIETVAEKYVMRWGRTYNGLRVGEVRKNDYKSGATAEATRSLKLIEALKKIENLCDHDDYGDYHNTCPACIANIAIENYNNQTP